MRKNLVFLFDVDNTLLDNDRVSADLKRYLEQDVVGSCGWERCARAGTGSVVRAGVRVPGRRRHLVAVEIRLFGISENVARARVS